MMSAQFAVSLIRPFEKIGDVQRSMVILVQHYKTKLSCRRQLDSFSLETHHAREIYCSKFKSQILQAKP